MKIWKSYASEHSMNLVMIGKFKQVSDAEETKELIDSLFENLPDLVDFDLNKDRYSAELHDFLGSKNVYNLTPLELIQFLYDISVDLEGSEIHIKTEEDDISGLQKLMLHKGAKIEIFSAHDYPESDKKE